MEYNTGEMFSVGIVEHQFDKTWSDVLTWYTGFHPAFSFNCSEIQVVFFNLEVPQNWCNSRAAFLESLEIFKAFWKLSKPKNQHDSCKSTRIWIVIIKLGKWADFSLSFCWKKLQYLDCYLKFLWVLVSDRLFILLILVEICFEG